MELPLYDDRIHSGDDQPSQRPNQGPGQQPRQQPDRNPTDLAGNFVPKVHPLDRSADLEDPFELTAAVVSGDPGVMLECILQEFIWIGWGEEQLISLFGHPGYPVLMELGAFFGEAEVRRRVADLIASTGRLRFTETIAEDDPEFRDDLFEESDRPMLYQITPPLAENQEIRPLSH